MNCWEFRKCPRETHASCPAYPDHGQECWKVAGTQCAQERLVKPTVREKQAFCWTCNFYINYARGSSPTGRPIEPDERTDIADLNRNDPPGTCP